MSFARQEAIQQVFVEYQNASEGQKHTTVFPILLHASSPGLSSWPGSSAIGRLIAVSCSVTAVGIAGRLPAIVATVAIRCFETLP